MEQRGSVERRLALLDDVLVHAAGLVNADGDAALPLRLCVERLLEQSEIARLTLMLDPRREELLRWVDELEATETLAEQICRRGGRSSHEMSRALRDARQVIRALAQELH
jgi:hypothetical protein